MSLTTLETLGPSTPLILQGEQPQLNPRFQHQMKLVGIVLEGLSLEEVNQKLQDCCFQRDPCFYERGGKNEKLPLSLTQAVALMEDAYADRTAQLPKEKEMGKVVIQGGVDATLRKRALSFLMASEKGYTADGLVLIAQSVEQAARAKEIFEELGVDMGSLDTVISDDQCGWAERGFEKLQAEGMIQGRYTLATDATFAAKSTSVAQKYLGADGFNGCAVDPIKDWLQEMKLYGYDEKLAGLRDAMIAFTLSHLNFEARAFHQAFKAMSL